MVKEEMMVLLLLQLINPSLRGENKVNEDAFTHLSNQLLVQVKEYTQQLERKQII